MRFVFPVRWFHGLTAQGSAPTATRAKRHERMFRSRFRSDTPITWDARLLLLVHAMAQCDLCEMERAFCEHGLAERRRHVATTTTGLLISPSGIAHFAGCLHKGNHQDYRRWGDLNAPRAWERTGRMAWPPGTSSSRSDG